MKLTGEAREMLQNLSRGGSVINIHGELPNEYANDEAFRKSYLKEFGEYPHLNESRWFKSISDVEIPDAWIEHRRGIFWGVNPGYKILDVNSRGEHVGRLYTRQQIDNVEAVNAIYSEYDPKDFGTFDAILAHLQTLELHPNIVIKSSEHGAHVYWFLTQPYLINRDETRLDRVRHVQHEWPGFVGGDKKAKDLARMLRIPGTHNYKAKYAPNYPLVEVVDAWLERTYTIEDFERLIPVAQEKPQYTPADVSERNGQQNIRQLNYWRAMLRNICADIEGTSEGGRNDKVFEAGLKIGSRIDACNGIESEALDRVVASAMMAGLSESEAKTAFESGFADGLKNPRALSNQYDISQDGGDPIVWSVTSKGDETTMTSEGEMTENDGNQSEVTSEGNEAESVFACATPDYHDEAHMEGLFMGRETDNQSFADAVRYRYGERFIYASAYGWLHYCGTHWVKDGAEAALERAITETIEARKKCAENAYVTTTNEKTIDLVQRACKRDHALVSSIKGQLKSCVTVIDGRFENSPDLLNCKNGVVNLRTGKITPHSPRQFFLSVSPVAYNPNADYSAWGKWLGETVTESGKPTDTEMVDFLQMAVGYTLTGHTTEEVLFYLYGPTRSGKGTFTSVITAMMGKPLALSTSFSTFTSQGDNDSQNFALAPLRPSRMISASESKSYERFNEAKIKQVTGGDPVQCSFKGRDHFEYKPMYKIWLSSNHPVNADPDDPAVWGRLRVIPFPNSKMGTEDKSLKAGMVQAAYLEGVLCWAVSGAMKWYATGAKGLTEPGASSSAKATHKAGRDHVQQWLDECAVVKEGDFASNADINESYTAWCKANNVENKKQTGLTQALNSKGYASASKKIKDRAQRGIVGFYVLKNNRLAVEEGM